MARPTYDSPYTHTNTNKLLQQIQDYKGREWDEYNLTLEQAEQLEVPYRSRPGRRKRLTSLKAIAEDVEHGGPACLDRLMDSAEPGSLLFYALTLITEKHVDAIGKAVVNELEMVCANNQFIRRHHENRPAQSRKQILSHRLRELDHGAIFSRSPTVD